VQISAIKVETCSGQLEEVAMLGLITTSTINPCLSDYFVNLTGITQQYVDVDGISLAESLARFTAFAEPELLLCSWGNDYRIMDDNCKLRGLEQLGMDARVVDLRGLFAAAGVPTEEYTSGSVHYSFDVDDIVGDLHNAVFDVRSMLAGLSQLGRTGADFRQWL
jgi:inhibitor of KinA sporulation pathway (predicted exonuclease)